MYYRRKIILAFLQLTNNELEKLKFQKLLFLFSQKKQQPEYEFIPYKFGCFSYSANADIMAMVKNGNLSETENNIHKNDNIDYLKLLKPDDQKLLKEILDLYGKMDKNTLIKHTYINYPYYAINSSIAESLLNQTQLNKVKTYKPTKEQTILFTIGYEGISLEAYLNKLIKNDIKLLIDVRHNPISMKYGFSKTTLKRYCESVGIHYIHIPEVGITSEKRQILHNQKDYDLLFLNYKKTTLSETEKQQGEIIRLLQEHKRVALTCFEANICQCHRKPLAETIAQNPLFEYLIKHI